MPRQVDDFTIGFSEEAYSTLIRAASKLEMTLETLIEGVVNILGEKPHILKAVIDDEVGDKLESLIEAIVGVLGEEQDAEENTTDDRPLVAEG